jgi:hypothetical protein
VITFKLWLALNVFVPLRQRLRQSIAPEYIDTQSNAGASSCWVFCRKSPAPGTKVIWASSFPATGRGFSHSGIQESRKFNFVSHMARAESDIRPVMISKSNEIQIQMEFRSLRAGRSICTRLSVRCAHSDRIQFNPHRFNHHIDSRRMSNAYSPCSVI